MRLSMKVDSHLWAARHLPATRARMSISSHVLPGLVVALDSIAILSAGMCAYALFVGAWLDDPSHYVAAVTFVWLVMLMLMNFAGLYRLEPIMRPFAFADKIVVGFATTILFLLAAAFSLKISTDFSRLWVGSFAAGSCAATL